MSTLTALVVWLLVSTGLLAPDDAGVLVGPGVDLIEPPPPTEPSDGQRPHLDEQDAYRRPHISNGF